MEEKIKEFEQLLESTNREGIQDLIAFLRKSDFYTAPASTRFHSCHAGGLLEHSLNVYYALKQKANAGGVWEFVREIPLDSLIITALLHDVCKTNFYATELRNKKVYSDSGTKRDAGGRYDWQTVESYTVDDKVPYGHGEKSVMMVETFIKLKTFERYAIRWHMGFTEPKESYNTLSTAISLYPFILALHESDLEATYLMEKEE